MNRIIQNIKFYLAWFIDYLFQASVITLAFVLPFSWIYNTTFLYAWEWFHRELMIYYLWYFAPVFTTFVVLSLFASKNKFLSKYLNITKYPKLLHKTVFFVLISIVIGSASQVAGGCIWQLPVILDGWAGYQWRRFGHDYFNDGVLIVFYSLVTVGYSVILHQYFNKFRTLQKPQSVETSRK